MRTNCPKQDTKREPYDVLRDVIAVLFIEIQTALISIQEQKLKGEVLHEMVQERLKSSPVMRSDSPHLRKVENEIRARIEAKKKKRIL